MDFDVNVKPFFKFLKFVIDYMSQSFIRIRCKDQFFYFINARGFVIISLESIYAVAHANQRKFKLFVGEKRQKISCIVSLITAEGSLYLLYVDYNCLLFWDVKYLTDNLLSRHTFFSFFLGNLLKKKILNISQTFGHICI